MARLDILGFESNDPNYECSIGGSYAVFSSTHAHSGTYSGRVYPPASAATSYIGINHYDASGAIANINLALVYFRFYIYIATLPAANNEEIFAILGMNNAQKMTLRVTSAGNLQLYDSAVAQIGSDGTTTLSLDTWYRIEVKCGKETVLGDDGPYEVKIEGNVEFTGTGNITASNVASGSLGKRYNRNSQAVDYYFDDIAVDDSEYPGPGEVYLFRPAGDGTYTAWTIGAGGGADWTNVDETPSDSNTTYLLSTKSIGDASTVTFQSCDTVGIYGAITTILALWVIVRNAATTPGIKFRVRSNATNYDTSAFESPMFYTLYGLIYNTDPATGFLWTHAAIDALEIGAVENSASQATRWSSMWLMVEVEPVEEQVIIFSQ